jgi:hypothetical protein
MPVLPLGNHKRLTLSMSTSDHTEGYLTRSPDGQYLALGGYDAAPGYASVVAAPYSSVKRVAGIVSADGTINTTTELNTFSGVSIRSVITNNGFDLWATGGGNGIRYATLGSTNSTAIVTQTGRCLHIAGNQLYTSSTATGFRVATPGTGLPITTGQTMTSLLGFPTASGSPYGAFLADLDSTVSGHDVLYVADEGNNGVSKYSLISGSWVFNSRVGSSADQYRGLTGMIASGDVVLYATRKNNGAASGGGEIVVITDTGGYNAAITGTPQVLATAAINTLIRGIALTPGSNSLGSLLTLHKRSSSIGQRK